MTLNNKSFFGRDIQSSCLEGHYEEIWKYINDEQRVNSKKRSRYSFLNETVNISNQ